MLAGASAATCFSVPRSCLHSANSAVIAGRALGRGRSVGFGVSELAGTGVGWGAMAVRGFQWVRTESVAFTSGSAAVTAAVPVHVEHSVRPSPRVAADRHHFR